MISNDKTVDLSSLMRERDLFKRQFIQIQDSYEKKIEELSILKQLGVTLRSTDFSDRNEFFSAQLKIIRKYMQLESISLMLLNESAQTLETIARDERGSQARPLSFSFEEDQSAIWSAVTQKKAIIIEDIQANQPIAEKEKRGEGSLLCVPVMFNEKAIGVISLTQRQAGSFNKNHVRFLSLVADQITTSIVLFRLYGKMLREEKQRFMLTRFFSKTVTDKIFESGVNLELGGERKYVTIVFADLRGFTAMSEDLDQEKVVEILNTYFSLSTPIIFKHNGTLDKLMGDGILAFFGAPISHKDDSLRAVKTAIEMIAALKKFNNESDLGAQLPLKVSIGINSGEVVAGYIGSEDHLNYTVIGDAVNVAQRLQSIAGENEIFISRSVKDEINENISEINGLKNVVQLPDQKVKGKERAIEVFKIEI